MINANNVLADCKKPIVNIFYYLLSIDNIYTYDKSCLIIVDIFVEFYQFNLFYT